MTIEIRKPELEHMLEGEIRSGHFHNTEDLLIEALYAFREKHGQIQQFPGEC